MSADDFFSRWSKRKAETPDATTMPGAAPVADPAVDQIAAPEPAAELPPPTLEDVAALNHDADFRRFVKPDVDEAVRRSAMKKLFTDPHFNVMDGLDIYIDDYNKFEPIPPAMLAMLAHAKPLLDPLGHLQQPAMKMLDRLEQLAQDGGAPAAATPDDAAGPAPAEAPAESVETPADDGQVSETAAVNDHNAASSIDTSLSASPESPQNPASPDDDHTI